MYPCTLSLKANVSDELLCLACGLSKLGHVTKNLTTESISAKLVPWLTFIYVNSTKRPPSFCSGTVINDRVVLTSASCLIQFPEEPKSRVKLLLNPQGYNLPPENVMVLLAKADVIDLENNATFERLQVDRIIFNSHFIYQGMLHK